MKPPKLAAVLPARDAVTEVRGATGFTVYVACEGRNYERRGFESKALAIDAAPKLARVFRQEENTNAYWDVKDGCGAIVEVGALEPPRPRHSRRGKQ